jgi:hypothetical protein
MSLKTSMSKNFVSKDELKCRVMKLKYQIDEETTPFQAEKELAHRYLNYVLNALEEYRG